MPKQRRRLRLLDPLRDVVAAVHNRNFRWVFLALLFIGISTGVSVMLLFYANTYFWEFSSLQIGLINLSSIFPTLLGFALLRPLVKRFEKKTIYIGAMVVMVLNGLWWIPGRLLGLLPPNGVPVLFALAILHQFILVISVMTQHTISAAIVADIVDEHEVETGDRMDGVFFAAMGFSMKIPTGLGQFLGGVLIDVVALPAQAAPGTLASDVLFRLGLVAGPLVSLSFLIPIVLLGRIRLDRNRHAELREILDARSASEEQEP
jgi:Na+/melibiose symporter-like transporter